MHFRLVFDVLNHRRDPPWLLVAALILLGVLLTGLALRHARRVSCLRSWALVVGLAAITVIGGLALAHFVEGEEQCRAWRRSGAYETLEGRVDHFVPMPRGGHAFETFSLRGRRFRYVEDDLSSCGFSSTASHGGPMRTGVSVRLMFHDDHILRLEIADP